jgi:tRNA A-37 threonylcarbamoyl transferase component Bud32
MSDPITEIHGPGRANRDGAPPPPPDPTPTSALPASTAITPLPLPDLQVADESPTIISRGAKSQAIADESVAAGLRGKRLAHFELLAPVGVGGMAAVIRARDTQLDRIVALKILPPQQARDPESARRFNQEARAAARLDHENIARVFYCGEDQGLHFIAFEFVEGANLRAVIDKRGQLPVGEAIHYMLQVATGLAHASARSVVHRDIKPSNIIITPTGRAKLVDMGLARSLGPHSEGDLTQSGVTLGTFDYISPEQALEPRDADCRSDIYSLGCTFYHMLTGQPPVPEGTAAKKLHHHQHVPPVDPRQLNPDIPDEVAAVLARMMAKEPRDRYQRPEHMVQHLIQIAQKLGCATDVPEGMLFVDAPLPGPPRPRPVLVGLIAVGILVALVAVLGALSSSPTASDPGTTYKPVKGGEAPVDDRPPPPPDPDRKGPAGDPLPPALKWAKARTFRELVQRVKDGASRIQLTGDLYEIKAEEELVDLPGLVSRGDELVIEAQDPTKRPTLALRYSPGVDKEQLWATLTLSGGKTTINGVRFVLDANGTPTYMAALVQRDGGSLTVRNCEFVQTGSAGTLETRHMSAVHLPFAAASNGPRPSVVLDRCFFQGGDDALYITGSGSVQLFNCAFGPHLALAHCQGGRARARDTDVSLDHCSVLLEGGQAAFLLDQNASARFSLNHCLVSCPAGGAELEAAVLIKQTRQTGDRTADIHYESQHKNVFHNLVGGYWLIESSKGGSNLIAGTLEEFKQKMEVNGSDRSIELLTNPWLNEKPIPLVDAKPKQAFQVNLKLPELRPEKDPTRHVIGVEACAWGALYELPLPAVEDKRSDPVIRKTKIVDPGVSESGDGIYPSLDQAAREARTGDTILIRANGVVAVDTVRLEKANTELTIKPHPRFRPILELGQTSDTDAALVRLHDGKLTFEGLEFRLRPQREFKAQSVVLMVGDGQCTFKNCVATLEPGKEVPLALVGLGDPAGIMKMEPAPRQMDPQVRLDNCFIRGEGDLIAVRTSRPFNLDVNDSLVVLDGSLLTIEAGAKEMAARAASQVNFHQFTAVLSKHLIVLRRDENHQVLVPTQVNQAFNCLFHAARGKTLIHLDGVDTEEQVKRFLTWNESKGNTYSGFTQMLDQQPRGETVMPLPPYDQDKWKAFTQNETERRFTRVKFAGWPVGDRSPVQAWPGDFKVKDPEGLKCGAAGERLPRPSGTEPEPPSGDGGNGE